MFVPRRVGGIGDLDLLLDHPVGVHAEAGLEPGARGPKSVCSDTSAYARSSSKTGSGAGRSAHRRTIPTATAATTRPARASQRVRRVTRAGRRTGGQPNRPRVDPNGPARAGRGRSVPP